MYNSISRTETESAVLFSHPYPFDGLPRKFRRRGEGETKIKKTEMLELYRIKCAENKRKKLYVIQRIVNVKQKVRKTTDC